MHYSFHIPLHKIKKIRMYYFNFNATNKYTAEKTLTQTNIRLIHFKILADILIILAKYCVIKTGVIL